MANELNVTTFRTPAAAPLRSNVRLAIATGLAAAGTLASAVFARHRSGRPLGPARIRLVVSTLRLRAIPRMETLASPELEQTARYFSRPSEATAGPAGEPAADPAAEPTASSNRRFGEASRPPDGPLPLNAPGGRAGDRERTTKSATEVFGEVLGTPRERLPGYALRHDPAAAFDSLRACDPAAGPGPNPGLRPTPDLRPAVDAQRAGNRPAAGILPPAWNPPRPAKNAPPSLRPPPAWNPGPAWNPSPPADPGPEPAAASPIRQPPPSGQPAPPAAQHVRSASGSAPPTAEPVSEAGRGVVPAAGEPSVSDSHGNAVSNDVAPPPSRLDEAELERLADRLFAAVVRRVDRERRMGRV